MCEYNEMFIGIKVRAKAMEAFKELDCFKVLKAHLIGKMLLAKATEKALVGF